MEKDCNNCRFEHYRADEIPCIHCGIDGREYWLPKAKTNADRIRAMTDEELANFMAERNVNESTLHRLDKDHGLTAVQIEAIKHNVYCALLQWLKQPAEGDA